MKVLPLVIIGTVVGIVISVLLILTETLPVAASAQAKNVDDLYSFFLAFSGIIFGIVVLIMLVTSMLFTAAYGWSVERIAYRPLRGSFRLAPLISAIGMSIFLQNYVQLLQGARVKSIQPVVTGGVPLIETGHFHVTITYIQIIIIGLTIALMIAFSLLIARTGFGRAQRACEQDQTMAALLGLAGFAWNMRELHRLLRIGDIDDRSAVVLRLAVERIDLDIAVMADVGDITVALLLHHRLIGGARLQVVPADQLHVFAFSARGRGGGLCNRSRYKQRQTRLQNNGHACHADSPRNRLG